MAQMIEGISSVPLHGNGIVSKGYVWQDCERAHPSQGCLFVNTFRGSLYLHHKHLGVPNFVNSRNSITFVGEELYDSNELQNIEIRTAAKPLP